MEVLRRIGFTRYEGLLGCCVMALGLLVFIPTLRGNLLPEKGLRATMKAETIARAVLDYHTDTGQWPADTGLTRDLGCLAQVPYKTGSEVVDANVMGTMINTSQSQAIDNRGSKPWLEEVPLDSWGRPYRVVVLESEADGIETIANPRQEEQIAGYPTQPPAGTMIIVFSAGANGIWDTKPVMWKSQPFVRLRVAANEIFTGDDIGFILPHMDEGDG